LLDTLDLPSLENRRLYLSLSTFFKIIRNLIYFPSNFHPSPVSSSLRCNHAHQYCIPLQAQITLSSHFYRTLCTCGTTYLWKQLVVLLYSCLNTTLSHFLYKATTMRFIVSHHTSSPKSMRAGG